MPHVRDYIPTENIRINEKIRREGKNVIILEFQIINIEKNRVRKSSFCSTQGIS